MKGLTLFSVLVGIFIYSCSTGTDPEYSYFKVKVDSIQVPQDPVVGETINFKLFGTVGGDGCHSFAYFKEDVSDNDSQLVVWGKRKNETACPAVMVYLRGKQYPVIAKITGYFKIEISQPDGTTLKDSVWVN